MFHLFNKIYLEHESFYSSRYDGIALSSIAMPHPISRLAEHDVGSSLVWFEYLASSFEGQENLFWKDLIQRPADRPYVIFCDAPLFHQLQLTYWRSIFKNPTLESVFDLYNYYQIDNKLKMHLKRTRSGKILGGVSGFYDELSFDEFQARYNSVEPMASLIWLDKSRVSFEYLLAHYAVDPKSEYGRFLIAKVRTLAWKRWFEGAESLKSELLNSVLEWSKLFPDLDEGSALISKIDELLAQDQRLKWITDEDFNEENLNYVVNTYPHELFVDIERRRDNLAQAIAVGNPSGTFERQEFVNVDTAVQTKHLFDNEIEKLLEYDVNRGFGCIFVADQLQSRSNQVFASLIYTSMKNQKLEELSRFRLK